MAIRNQVQGEGVLQGVQTVPMADIIADEKFNARKDYNGEPEGKKDSRSSIEALAQSIKRDGQLQPVLVSKDAKGKYYLRFGFRRFKALQHLKMEHIKVQLWEGEEKDAVMINLAENCARNDLQPWELALRCLEISETYELEGKDIAIRIGKSKSHVNNLIRIAANVHKKILEAWSKGDGRATFDNMIALARTDDHDEQWEQWEAWGGEGEGEGDGESEPAGDKPEKAKRPSKRHLEAALDALKSSNQAAPWKEGCKAALRFALGKVKTIPQVYNPDKPPSEDDE
jgi:ParB/RepB/Spo0J family partition protein